MGSHVHPVRLDVLEAHCQKLAKTVPKSHTMSNWQPGPVATARRIVEDQDGSTFVEEPNKHGPRKLPPLNLRKCCIEVYPGLCAFRGRAIISPALDIAQNLNSLCSKYALTALLGRVWHVRFTCREPGPLQQDQHVAIHFLNGYLWLAHVRQSRPQAQMFCPLKLQPSGKYKFTHFANDHLSNYTY